MNTTRARNNIPLLIAVLSCLWLAPAHAASAPTLKTMPLKELLALARTLVTEDILSEGQGFIGSDAEDEREQEAMPRWSDDADRLRIMLGVSRFRQSEEKYDIADDTNDPDIRRITQLLHCNVFGIFQHGSLLPMEGKIDRQGDTRLPSKWLMALHIDGSLRLFQRQLLLTPFGLLDKAQVNDVIATLKAAGNYQQKIPDSKSQKRIEDFAQRVNGLPDENDDFANRLLSLPDDYALTITEEQLIFDAEYKRGVHIIIAEERPKQYALFLLMGQPDFGDADAGICKRN